MGNKREVVMDVGIQTMATMNNSMHENKLNIGNQIMAIWIMSVSNLNLFPI